MIDLSLYRCRIGLYGGGVGKGNGGNFKDRGGFNSRPQGQDYSVFIPTGCPTSTKFYLFEQSNNKFEENIVHSSNYFMYNKLFMLLYFYLILIFTIITFSFVCSTNFKISLNICPGVVYLNWDLSFITISQIKVAYFYLIFYVIFRSIFNRKKWPKIYCPHLQKFVDLCEFFPI